jgi:hypothetical protein
MTPKIVAKMYRLKMLSDVREFVESLPFNVTERQVDHCIYSGTGEVDTGMSKFPTVVQIVSDDGIFFAIVKSPKAGIMEEFPFGTDDQRKKAAEAVQALMFKYLN